MHPLASTLFELFGKVLDEAFKRTQKIQYLNESISTRRQVLGRPSVPSRHVLSESTSEILEKRWNYYPMCANDETATLPDRSCHWTMPHTRSTCVKSGKRLRPLKEGGPYFGQRCAAFRGRQPQGGGSIRPSLGEATLDL
ncbi:hypothetical protein H4582DRAFT_2060525 [Lactarius indigo]|nr:hypothetical protein H4582DRAFT_2060525 [Lactarius indigo]